ncbi:MAG: hypothetical protein ACREBY_18340 [Polaromonas sp.]
MTTKFYMSTSQQCDWILLDAETLAAAKKEISRKVNPQYVFLKMAIDEPSKERIIMVKWINESWKHLGAIAS